VEEGCVLKVPSVQMRRSTERPEVYDVSASVRFDPAEAHSDADRTSVVQRVEALSGREWSQPFGDGTASRKIASDIIRRGCSNQFGTHAMDASIDRVKRAIHGNLT
jgi:UDP-N-acetylglucosamine 2-epimerase